jgi:hypothetical protein
MSCSPYRWTRLGELLPLYVHLFGSYPSAPLNNLEAIHSSLGLVHVSHSGGSVAAGTALANPATKSDLDRALNAHFKMTVNKRLENPFGSLHGQFYCLLIATTVAC